METYMKPTTAARFFNRLLGALIRIGFSPRGAQLLTVKGRRSGERRTTPVNPLTFGGARYLVAPRGSTHWARNLRAVGEGELSRGRRKEAIRVTEVADAEKPPILRVYLERWAAETKAHFGLDADASDAELAAIAAAHPVFRIL
jgi:deazaflavin-dependent oxidoreductase (nitroreductase family)